MTDPLDLALNARLDRLAAPPPLPAGFAEKLAALAAATPQVGAVPPAAPPRRAPGGRWRSLGRRARTGLIAGGLALAGLGSVSAAAAGYLGEPVSRAVQALPVVGPGVVRLVEKVIPHKPAPAGLRAKAAKPATPEPARPVPADRAPVPAARPDAAAPGVAIGRALAEQRKWRRAHPDATPEDRAARRAALRETLREQIRATRAAEREAVQRSRAERGITDMRALSPEQRAMVRDSDRQVRQAVRQDARRNAVEALRAADPQGTERLSPAARRELRRAIMEERRARMQERRERGWWRRGGAGPDAAPPVTPP